ncbi:MAG: 30S ribosomal protein S6 [Patescibacteria group bacterium]
MKYELSFIISPAIPETDHLSVNQQVLDYLKGIEANVTRAPYFMGRRKLAYPIAKQKHGFYVCLEFTTEDKASLKELDIKLKHNNSLLRHLIIKLENRSESAAVDFSKMEERDTDKAKGRPVRKARVSAPKSFSKKSEPRSRQESKVKVNLDDIDKQLDRILDEPKVD